VILAQPIQPGPVRLSIRIEGRNRPLANLSNLDNLIQTYRATGVDAKLATISFRSSRSSGCLEGRGAPNRNNTSRKTKSTSATVARTIQTHPSTSTRREIPPTGPLLSGPKHDISGQGLGQSTRCEVPFAGEHAALQRIQSPLGCFPAVRAS